MEAAHLQELSDFILLSSRPDIKATALNYVLGLSGTADGCNIIMTEECIVQNILDIVEMDQQSDTSRDALSILLNLTANDEMVLTLYKLNITQRVLQLLTVHITPHNKYVCMILSNLTRHKQGAVIFTDAIISTNNSVNLTLLIDLIDKNTDQSMDYIATILSNITQTLQARLLFLNKSDINILSRLLPHIQLQQSLIRRGGIIGLIRNLCFEIGKYITHTYYLIGTCLTIVFLLIKEV